MSKTLDELRDGALRKADETDSDYYETHDLDRSINQAYRFVYGRLVQKFQDLFEVVGTEANGGLFDTVDGTQGYALPTGMRNLTGVEYRDINSTDDNEWEPVSKKPRRQPGVDDYNPPREGRTEFPFSYFLSGTTIYFKPVPEGDISIRLWFVPGLDDLSDGSDEIVFSDDYAGLIEELAALDILGTSGEEIFAERFKLFELKNSHLNETATQRDAEPPTMLITSED